MWKTGTLIHCRWECEMVQPLCKTVMGLNFLLPEAVINSSSAFDFLFPSELLA